MLPFLIPANCPGSPAQIPLANGKDRFGTVMDSAASSRKQGNNLSALNAYREAEKIATAENNLEEQSRALLGEGSCYLRLFRYREALAASEQAFTAATSAKNDTRAGAAAGNKATIYDQLGDKESASVAAEEAVRLLEHSAKRDYYAQALLTDAYIQDEFQRHDRSVALFQRAIAVAQQAKLPVTEALAEDQLGFTLVEQHNFIQGRHYLEEARRIRSEIHDPDLILTQTHLSELDWLTGDFRGALTLIDGVLQSPANQSSALVRYWPPLLKGKILLSMGRTDEAIAYFTKAVQLADDWRQDALPSETTGTQTDALLAAAYDDFIQNAAAKAVKDSNPVLARKALTVLIAHRAWTLRDQLIAARGREMRLPPRYYELLSQIQSTQALVTLSGKGPEQQRNRAKLTEIRAELTDLENKTGIQQQNFSLSEEKDAHQTSLRSIQSCLGRQDLLLSFYLGTGRSFVWAVTSNQMKLYELPASDDVGRQAYAFKEAVRTRTSAVEAGVHLSQTLFAQLPGTIAAKRNWLIAADGPLLDGIPFSSLPAPGGSHAALITDHTLRLIPSEALLESPRTEAPRPVFVGVADPIYNRADSRLRKGVSLTPVSHQPDSVSLARLVASDREVRSAGIAAGLPSVHILTGANASGARIAEAIADRPEILHFAVHVVTPDSGSDRGNDSEQAALALSLANGNMPELLTRESIAALRVPGTLVVLSGCASEQGAVLPSAGLVGLSRAWLLAGASAVLVTAWPTPDDSGTFFQIFYRHFHDNSGTVAQRATAALQQTQSEMKAGSGYRSDAAFWSAYSLISKE